LAQEAESLLSANALPGHRKYMQDSDIRHLLYLNRGPAFDA
jgi:hypothetical protein